MQEALGRIAYDRLILSARWALNYHGGRFDNGEGGIEYGVNGAVRVAGQSFTTDAKRKAQLLDHMRTEITKHSRTLIHTQIPEAGWHVPRLYTKYALFGAVPKAITTSRSMYHKRNDFMGALLTDIPFIDASTPFCNDKRCVNTSADTLYYMDDDHLSKAGAALLASHIVQQLL